MDESLKEYRQHLVLAVQKAQGDFDKTVLSLSGGALGVSFAFIDKIVRPGVIIYPKLLFFAWLCWGISMAVILASYLFSHLTLRRAIKQVDQDQIYNKRPGGFFAVITHICNISASVLFFVGVLLVVFFVKYNMKGVS